MNINRIFIHPSDSGLRNFNKSLWGVVSITTKPRGYFFEMENEIWKDIPGYEGKYQVSSCGRVKSLSRKVNHRRGNALIKERILKCVLSKAGYPTVALHNNNIQKTANVHQLVAMAFLGHVPCGYIYVVNHKNFDRSDNSLENIEIVTQRTNTNLAHIKSSSKYVGVYWHKIAKRWAAAIRIKGKRMYLGYFDEEHDANLAYQRALSTVNS